MMRAKIREHYPHHQVTVYATSLHVVDYTEQTQSRKQVEVLDAKPTDIDSFFIDNSSNIGLGVVVYNNNSFVDDKGQALTQCECMGFSLAESNPWVLFLELKYCQLKNQRTNLLAAKKKLLATYGYYTQSKPVLGNGQMCYLIASTPQHANTPFENFVMTQGEIVALRKRKIVFRGVNKLRVRNEQFLLV